MSETTGYCRLCLSGLERMYDAERHLFSASYRLEGDTMTNLEEPGQQFKYTLNTLMGLDRAARSGIRVFTDPRGDYAHVVARAGSLVSDPENLAAAVWAGQAMGVEVPATLLDAARRVAGVVDSGNLTAQAMAWMMLASAEPASTTHALLPKLLDVALSRYAHPATFLVRHLPSGYRTAVASFAASCYMAYALLVVARESGDERAHKTGLRVARKLVSLQGPDGQWAWFYHVPRGEVVDYYPVYSVHQHAMAPLFLLAAIDLGHTEFRDPLLRGFAWILGPNEAGATMVSADHRVIWRSVERRGAFQKVVRGLSAARGGRDRAAIETNRMRLRLNSECRSYELGWGLWAFAGRSGFDDILNDAAFETAAGPG